MKPENRVLLLITTLISTSMLLSACSSNPPPARDPYNDADSQRSRAGQSQGELSRETR